MKWTMSLDDLIKLEFVEADELALRKVLLIEIKTKFARAR